jgi:hypothetical protein
MSKIQIESWLSRDDDYQEGLSLYLRFGNNDFLKNLFAKGETVFNRSKLRKELTQIGEEIAEDNQEKKTDRSFTDQEYARLPDEGKALQKQWKIWYSEMNALRHQLPNPMTETARHEMALRILKLDDNVREAWRKLDFWRSYGELPSQQPELIDYLKSLPVIDLVKRKNNLSTYLSKFKDDDSKIEKLLGWKTELLQIQQILDGAI